MLLPSPRRLLRFERLPSLFVPPPLSDPEAARTAATFHGLAWGTMAAATVMLGSVALIQPDVAHLAFRAILRVNLLGVGLLVLNALGFPRLAGGLFIAGLLSFIALGAIDVGGIRSPGIGAFFVFSLMGGLLLGQGGAAVTALACGAIGLGLVIAEHTGVLPPATVRYSPWTLWMLNGMYLVITLLLVRSALLSLSKSLAAAREELALRETAELKLRTTAESLGERVKELRLLHATAQLLRDRRFELSLLEDLVRMIPGAWRWPDRCEARIRFRDFEVASPGFRETRWKLSSSFSNEEGDGTIEVIYSEDVPAEGDDPFLPEERVLIGSIAEMLSNFLSRDLAERRRAAMEHELRQAQKMEALGTLAGGIAHDFNNLLAAITVNAELARQQETLVATHGHLDRILRAGERGKGLIRRILLFSRGEAGEKVSLDLRAVIEEAVELSMPALPKQVGLKVEASEALPRILGDSTQLCQVFLNLLTNAGHAMAGREGEISVRLDPLELKGSTGAEIGLLPGQYLRVRVKDDGVGMSPEVQSRIFEPFFTTKGTAGTGLGLSVVYGIVRDHGGHVGVLSETGRGTTFELLFPALKPVTEDGAPPQEATARGHGEHVLCVDDDEAIAVAMKRLIEWLGYSCTSFTDPRQALAAFRSDPSGFHALVTDFTMSGMNGIELATECRKSRGDFPVAILSGHGDQLSSDFAGQERIRVLSKPTGMTEIANVLRDLVAPGRESPT